MTTVAPEVLEAVAAAAEAAASALPSAALLVPGTPVFDVTAAPVPADAATAVVAGLAGSVRGSSLVVIGADLVEALRSSPLGELDVAAAVQPALTAAGAAFGQVVVESGRELPVDVALDSLAGAGMAVAVPLLADGEVRATYAAVLSAAPSGAGAGTAGSGPRTARGLDLLRDV
ncbi:flagellar motor switch protein FliN, partial [Motilibacter deserti]